MATLHFICGRAGAGKTTLARELGRMLPAAVFCEDEWVDKLGFEIHSFDDAWSACLKVRGLIGPLAGDLLRLGVSAGNTIECRQWVRTIFEAADADHVLHVIETADAQCLANIQRRNKEKPAGVYWGDVTEEMFHRVNIYFVPPQHREGFQILVHDSREAVDS